MRAFAAACAVLAWAATAGTAPAFAVDRTLGADVPKPSASGAPWSAAQIAALRAGVDSALAGAKTLRSAHVGVYAIDARNGRVLYARNQDEAFQPASTFKLLVGSAALDTLGPTFRFRTDVVANGTVSAGVLDGELVLRGGGDPFLKAADLDAAAAAVAQAGITRVRDIVLDDRHFEAQDYPPGWSWDDFAYYYAPLVSGLAFEENVVHLTVTPGSAPGARATVRAAPVGLVGTPVEGCQPGLTVRVVPAAATGVAGAKDTLDIEHDRAGCIIVSGAIPAGAKPDTIDAAVVSPAAYAYEAFAAALARHGVTGGLHMIAGPFGAESEHRFGGTIAPAAAVLWSHDSEPMRDVLADMWLPSDNLVAEMLLRELGVASNGPPGTMSNGIALEKAWLARIGIDAGGALSIDDGSGLSAYDRITPAALVQILKHDWDGAGRDIVLDALPIAGVRGTLKSAWTGTPVERHVFAKTGGLSHVSTLAGYAANAKHGAVIFAFQVDDWVGDVTALRDVRARVLTHFVAD